MYAADLRDILEMEPMPSYHLTESKDVQTKFGPAAVLKTLTGGVDLFDIIPTNVSNL